MKKKIKKILVLSVVLLGIFIFGSDIAQAYVGQTLIEAEPGWTRYDDRDISRIIYHTESFKDLRGWFLSNNGTNYYNSTSTYAAKEGIYLQFVVNGSAFKILGGLCKTCIDDKPKNAEVYIDGEFAGDISMASKIEGVHIEPGYLPPELLKQDLEHEGGSKVLFEYKFKESGQHIVKLNVTSLIVKQLEDLSMICNFQIDAIDTDGELLEMNKLIRYYNPNTNQHFYTTDYSEIKDGKYGYYMENEGKPQCMTFKKQEKGTVPLYRYCSLRTNDHFYTINFSELGYGNSEYILEGNVGYVYDHKVPGAVRLYRYCDVITNNHFYTTNFAEVGNGRWNYILESMNSYVLSY